MNHNISQEFIIGLLTQKGSFTFSTRTKYNRKRERTVHKIPTFSLTMNKENEDLMNAIKDRLKIKNKLYKFNSQRNDNRKRNTSITLIVRELSNIERMIIPFFHKKFIGYRTEQFNNWLLAIEKDPLVPFSYKKIYWRHKSRNF
ncbi:MAG: LAGLIDADG family homing endonuclease [Patescibacteria group bacterium]